MQECAQDLQEIMHKMQKLQEKMQGGGMMGQRSYMRYGQRNNMGGQNFSGNGGNFGQRWGNMPMMNGQGFMGDNSPMMMSGQAEIDPRFFAMFD